MTFMRSRLLWIAPEKQGGIQSYSDVLWPEVRGKWVEAGFPVCEPLHAPLRSERELNDSLEKLVRLEPSLIHIQHEYGLFGSKVPGRYSFPAWLKKVRAALPKARVILTGHSVFDFSYRYPLQARGWQTPMRALTNAFFIRHFARYWNFQTWGKVDGVIVHSRNQLATIEASRAPRFSAIPHFVPTTRNAEHKIHESLKSIPQGSKKVVVFGYFTPEKGQDIALRAFQALGKSFRTGVSLILAGGLRRAQDRAFHERCLAQARELGIADRVWTTGYVEPEYLEGLYGMADLVLAPFRETSGSGTLAQAFARGMPVLASDLPLNREITEREPGCLAFFRSEDPEDCAGKIKELLANDPARETLKAAARRYAEKCAPARIAEEHVRFYQEVLNGAMGGC
ncbi:MAG: hypothetical protein A2428_16275 [Bdellovibrionales bacterium RIFOXYC1_FULL_54_43]|nr:MAG: hypothetical protein A2428_16275 [Bdellovibrionales bacterium RIFOXYC1_FULL_54_43]